MLPLRARLCAWRITLGPLVLWTALAPACAGDDAAGTDTAATTDASGTTAGDGSSTTASAEESPIYGPCDEICALDLSRQCIAAGDGSGREFCTETCAAASDCPPAPGGAAVPDCVDPGMGSICFLNCSGGAECPAGMVCQQALTTEGARSLCFVEPG
ncbi:MAG: hypothetical protein KC486_26645 [Myxococcales bacterium]|nr:hypothetical protein [Myxococcales bacterium]